MSAIISQHGSKLLGEKSLSLIGKETNAQRAGVKASRKKQRRKTVLSAPTEPQKPADKDTKVDWMIENSYKTRRIIPDAAFEIEQERELKRIATRGVVLLFNQTASSQGEQRQQDET